MGDVGTINSFDLLVVSFKLLLGARTSSFAMSEANSRARLRRVADKDVRAPSKHLKLANSKFLTVSVRSV